MTLHFTRNATIDDVTGLVSYSDWIPVDATKTGFDAFSIPTIDGYTPKFSAGTGDMLQEQTPTQDQITNWGQNEYVVIDYMANNQAMNNNYVDAKGNNIATFKVTGKTDQTVDTNAQIPAGWVLVSGQTDAPAKVTFGGTPLSDINIKIEHGMQTVPHTNPIPSDGKTSSGQPIKGAHDADLNQTIVRTINITEPGQATKTITQTAKIYRDATVDEVTGDVTYDPWSTDTTDWTSVDIPVHDGYTVHQSDGKTGIPAVEVKDGQADEDITVTYTANDQTGKIVYVDVDNNNTEVGHTDLAGKNDQNIMITPQIPAGYDQVTGQTIPASVKAGADGIPTVTVKVNHHKITVKPGDEPKPGDKKPGNPGKKPGDGTPKTDVSYETLHRNMTRTINVTDPHTGLHTTKVTIHYERTATIDDVTGNVTYGDWTVADGSDTGFAKFDIPPVAGYTSEIKSGTADELNALTPTQDQITNWSNQTVDIDYTANDQTGKIVYVDVDNKNVEVGHTNLTGKTDATITITPAAPAGYDIVAGQNIPASEVATATGIPTVTVKVSHHKITVKPGDEPKPGDKKPANPGKKPGDGTPNKDISYEDLHKSTTRTITIHDPHNGNSVDKETININRIATIDDVTGDVTYGNWTIAPDSTQDRFNNITYPIIPGYTMTATPGDHSAKILSQDDINNWVDPQIDVSYTAQDQSGKISYVDPNGQEVAHTELNGKTDATINIKDNINVPTNWKIVPGQTIPDTVKATANGIQTVRINIEHDTITVPATDPKTPADKLPDGTNYPSGVSQNDLNKTITRTINITKPGEATQTTTQKTSFSRSATIDLVNHKITYTDWAQNGNNGWVAVDIPAVDGYAPSVSNIAEVDVTPDTANTTVNVTYTANDQKQVVNYVDDSGKIVNSETINGKTGNNVTINVNVPNHYELVPGQNIPANVTLKTNNTPITVKVTPKLDPITNPDLLNKTITRTITINKPKAAPQVITQKATFTRTGNTNEVTDEQTFSDWTLNINKWTEVDAPAVPGYTPDKSKIDAVNVTPDMTNTRVAINYLTNAQTGKISYVDGEGSEVSHTDLAGKTGDTININPQAPVDWKIVEGQNIPKTVVAGPDGIPTVTVQVEHDTITVTPDQPKNPSDKLPDGKNYPSGVGENDLNQTISRKITINVPNKPAQVINQKADFTRSATIDLVNHEITYGDWKLNDNSLNHVDVPVVPGYTASQTTVDGITDPTVNTKLSDITVDYTANEQGQVVNYVDPSGKTVKSDTVPGHTGEIVDITVNVPDHYILVPGQTVPRHVTLTDNNNPITIQVQPKIDNITDPAQLNKTISRTITINVPGQKPQVINQSANFSRTGTHNEVTGEDNFSNWTLKSNGLVKVDAPTVAGYTPSQATVAVINNPTVNTKLNNVTIDYTANAQNQVINYVDDSGKVVKSDTISGKTGDNVKIDVNVPDHYVLVPGQEIPSDVTLTTKNTPITIKVTPKIDDVTNPAQLNKTVTRKITVTNPVDGKSTTTTQTATFTRTGKTNEVTGKTTYTDWKLNNNGLTDFKPADVPGYTPSISDVPAVENPTADATFKDINITYTANDQTMHITYVDKGGKPVDGGSFTVTGKTDQTVNTNAKIPAGWVLATGQTDAPKMITFTGTPTVDIMIMIEHGTTSVPHPNPVKPGTKTPTGKDITGAHDADLNQTITRKVTIHEPGKVANTITQVAKIFRDATVDEVTGEVTYGKWSTDATDWTEIDAPVHAGYTVSQAKVDAVTVADGQKDVNIDITYAANVQAGKIVYVDVDNNNTEVGHTDLAGKTNGTVAINPKAPTGYDIVAGQNIPASETATAEGIPTVTVKVNHHKITITPGQEPRPGNKIPANPDKKPGDGTPKTEVSYETLHRNMTRTINVTDPHTGLKTAKVTLNFQRTATIDDVTGDVTYGAWTVSNGSKAEFDAFTIPAVAGYTGEIKSGTADELQALTPTQDQITNWQDQTVDVDYKANNQSMTIDYVDKDGNPVDGGHFVVSGKTDQTVDTNAKIPTGWVLSQGQTDAPKTITFTGTPTANIKITVEHGIKNVPHGNPVKPGEKTPSGKDIDGAHDTDLNQTITRTVNIIKPGQKTQTITQTAKIFRDATVDEVTGIVTYGAWSTDDADWTAVDVPAVPGYKAVQSDGQTGIPAVTVKDGQKNVTIDVTYTANAQSMNINYVDAQGNNITTFKVSGKTGQTVDTNAKIPAGWVLAQGQHDAPATITFTDTPTADINVVIEHGTHKVTHDKPAQLDEKTPTGKVIKGAHEGDLNKTITRTINVTTPGSKTVTTKQDAKLFRDATVDDVTGEVTYGDWSTSSWDDFKPAAIDGYTASQTDFAQTPVTSETKPVTVNITYTANGHTTHIIYQGDGKTIKTDTVTGKTGQTVEVPANIPAGWKLVAGQSVPKTIAFGPDGHADVVVTIEHATKTVTPETPADEIPNGKVPGDPSKIYEKMDSLTAAPTRTITITKPDGTKQTITQKVTFTRTATFDEVTGEITYSAWQTQGKPQWAAYTPAAIPGYTVDAVASENVTADTPNKRVEISYIANAQSVTIKFVDDDSGTQVGPDIVKAGKTDQVIADLGLQVPEHYQLAAGQELPTSYTFTAAKDQLITIHLVEKQISIDPTDPKTNPDPQDPDWFKDHGLVKEIMRTIIDELPGGTKTLTQTATLHRTATYNEVTGQLTDLSDWNTEAWDGYQVNIPVGYTAKIEQNIAGKTKVINAIDPEEVTVDTPSQIIMITYVPKENPTSPTAPTDPITPTSPTAPTDPTTPTSPTAPTDPTTPTSPTVPANPTTPVTPTTQTPSANAAAEASWY